MRLEAGELLLTLGVDAEISIEQIEHRTGGRTYLSQPSPLFAFAVDSPGVDNKLQHSNTDLGEVRVDPVDGGFRISAAPRENSLDVSCLIRPVGTQSLVRFAFSFTNRLSEPMFLRVVLPKITGLVGPRSPAG